MLEFQNVSYQYPSEDFDIIDHLSFAVEPGSFHCIIGISGCGKSTIFRMTNGLLKPKAGTILVEGKSIVGRKHYCGYMPQKDLLFPWRTVGENVALPLEIQGELTRAERRDRAEAALADVGLAGCGSKMPDELSGGMRQRAAFARTMLTGCDLLLLDEPFSALDFLTRISMQEWLLDQWQRHKRTILFITHDVEEALFLSSSVLVVERTHIRELADSYKEAQTAIEVGKVFDTEKSIINYENLGLGRLIYQLPTTLCEIFLSEVFKKNSIDALDQETLFTINKFFENNLNVSETARKLFVHRNTLVYRLEKIKKLTGLDLREFDDAITFKVALMVKKYLISRGIDN